MNNENDSALEKTVAAILGTPVPEGPPENVRRFVQDLGSGDAVDRGLKDRNASGPVDGRRIDQRSRPRSEWWQVLAAAALLLVAVNGGWLFWIHRATPVGWVYNSAQEEWVQLFDNSTTVRATPPDGSRDRG